MAMRGTKKAKGSGEKQTLAERFCEYHKEHPATYEAFKRHAARLRRYGHRHLSAQYICDYISFETPVDMRPEGQEFKFNHDFGPFYARMLRHEDESYGKLFEYRASIADAVDVAALVKAA